MIERTVDLPTADGEMNSLVICPEEGGPHPVVLFLMDAPGMREELRDMARRLASAGYWIVAPNLYYRDEREFDVFTAGDRDRMFELMASLTPDRVLIDADGMLAAAEADPAADASRVGVVGYCMSGHFVVRIAAHRPDVVKAAASFHGVGLATDADDSPHRLLPGVTGEIYIGAAEVDSYAPPEVIERFESAMAEHGTAGRVEWYPGTEHGFVFPTRQGLYVREAAERHWERLHELFRRTLAS